MQSVQFNIVTRAKYRSVAIQPELDAPNNKSDITAKKKIFVEKVFVLEEEEKVNYLFIIFLLICTNHK